MGALIQFDQYEAAVLLEALLKVKNGQLTRGEAAKQVSVLLRNRAKRKGFDVDASFRTESGISAQLGDMDRAYTGTESPNRKTQKLFIEIVELYRTDKAAFDKIIREESAGMEKQMPDIEFWLDKHYHTKAERLSRNLAQIQKFSIKKGLLTTSLEELEDYSAVEKLLNELLKEDTLVQGKDHKIIALKRTLTILAEYINERNNKTSDEELVDIATKIIDFSGEADFTYSRPLSFSFFNEEPVSVDNWADLYAKVWAVLWKHYSNVLKRFIGSSFDGGIRVELCDKNDASLMKAPKSIGFDLYVETNHSAQGIVGRIGKLLDICNVDRQNLRIRYIKKDDRNNKTKPATEEKKQTTPKPQPASKPAPSKPIEVQSNWIKFDFSNAIRFTGTYPVYAKIGEDEYFESSWAQLLISVVDYEISTNNPNINNLYVQSLSGSEQSPFFLKEKIDNLRCALLSNGCWININYNLPQLVKRIAAFCSKCGYSDSQIQLYGAFKENKIPEERLTSTDTSATKDRETKTAESTQKTADTSQKKQSSEWILAELEDRGIKYKDLRDSNGCLWMAGDKTGLHPFVAECQRHGYTMRYVPDGCRAFPGEPVWWTKQRMATSEHQETEASEKSVKEDFAKWLSERKSLIPFVLVWPCYHEIEIFCLRHGILKQSLFETTDIEVIKEVQKTINKNKLFTVVHKKQLRSHASAIQYYIDFIEERYGVEPSEDVIPDDAQPSIPDEDKKESVENRDHKKEQPVLSENNEAESSVSSSETVTSQSNSSSTVSDKVDDHQYEAAYPFLYSKLFAASKVYDDPDGLSLDRICSIINMPYGNIVRDILSHVSWAVKVSDDVFSFSKTKKPVSSETSPSQQTSSVLSDDYPKDRFIEVLMNRFRNGMMFDSIDFDNFRETYEMLYESQIGFDDSELEERLRHCGILYKDRLFPADGVIDPETSKKLYEYIDNSFASGKTVLYYKAIYSDQANLFDSCYSLADEVMLRAYIEYTAEQGKYYFTEKYLSVSQDVTVDNGAEITDYLLSAGKPMTIDAVAAVLSHIPKEQVQNTIYTDSHFLRNAKGEYFHADIFDVSDEELDSISGIIDSSIEENEYAIWTAIWKQIKVEMPTFIENNLYLSRLGIRNALAPYLSQRFFFYGPVISSLDNRYGMDDVFKLFAKHHSSFMSDELYDLSKESDTSVSLYLFAVAEVSVRVSYDLFVSKDMISFDIDAIDNAIGGFMAKDYIPIREINSFLAFPNVGYQWNEYLLESYVFSYSKKYMLVYNVMAFNNVAGAIVRKGSSFTDFVDVCAALLAESHIELKKESALNFLVEQNMITQKRYSGIENAIQKAKRIRAEKE